MDPLEMLVGGGVLAAGVGLGGGALLAGTALMGLAAAELVAALPAMLGVCGRKRGRADSVPPARGGSSEGSEEDSEDDEEEDEEGEEEDDEGEEDGEEEVEGLVDDHPPAGKRPRTLPDARAADRVAQAPDSVAAAETVGKQSSLMAEIQRAARARGEMGGGPPDCMLSLQSCDGGGAEAPSLFPAHSHVSAPFAFLSARASIARTTRHAGRRVSRDNRSIALR